MKEFAPRGRFHFVVKQKVASAQTTVFPILYLEGNDGFTIMWSLVRYFLAYPSKSDTWMRDTARAIGLFYDYCTAYQNSNSDRRTQLRNFMSSLENGTIGVECQTDPTALYWAPTGITKAKRLRSRLIAFINWVEEEELLSKGISTFKAPMKTHEKQTLSLMKTARKIIKLSPMEHTKDPNVVAQHLSSAQTAFGHEFEDDPKDYINDNSETKSFPIELISPLLQYGFVKNPLATDPFEREDITAKMITLLLSFGGLRKSEPLHLWFNDIIPTAEFKCQARLYHPRMAKTNLIGERDKTRDMYLRERTLRPRHDKANSKSLKAGWKKLAVDKSSYHADIFWLHPSAEAMFTSLYNLYLSYRSELMETYIKEQGHDHPFLFVSTGVDHRTGESYIGAPYSISQFDKSYEKALQRLERHLGLKIPRGRESAINPHSLRHFFTQALEDMGVSPKMIQKCLRHRTIGSQDIYKGISSQRIRETLENYAITTPTTNCLQILK
ncbi:TPA: tyrosine-type recombinase/integrase [Vibrio parahaemolyticus]|uniref:site-specific integrase n=1 Tax=Vibrio parahaemolyticus TaxID=670 RepID=UPI002071086B|nr:site-specific integrase [Vibrio parahaemolyticus]EIJ0973488.1 tyrosine-type recombinase/integrase [Vibrio parahaemolyticus]UPR05894.1 tyrosine-type recombinase/integrase [Vibrio parahaemolyticus]HAV1378315.1 tyrosine-type recombinase/integrase [Vibrio parahaemolyticus]HAV1409249.1 tyrosine-type recombinase/integrase [Vibrio parahaemolyticus]HAV1465843.1 tyrosine-type recombinase/integrase [Vibrio parahaemolyticus]